MKPLVAFSLAAALLPAAGFKAGLGRVVITPKEPTTMSGYAGRTGLSQGVVHDLWAKALALDDGRGSRVVFVTLDLVSISKPMADRIGARLKSGHGLDRAGLVLNVSHTHAGPTVGGEYERRVEDAVVQVAAAALQDLAPARISFASGRAEFGGNRRERTPEGIKIGVNPQGPTDRDVPVLLVESADGRRTRGILFGYACHNTTLGSKNYLLSGDYAGFAQIELEKRYPGATALYMQLCGGDQNPQPRLTMELTEQHGKSLATAVAQSLTAKPRRVRPPVRVAFEEIPLVFAPHTRETFEKRLNDPEAVRASHARRMLRLYDEGRPIRSIPYPVQGVRLGGDVSLVFLGGETVVDYALRIKREAGRKPMVVAGYSNDVMCYIPSLRVLKEGGYEADRSLLYDDMPGPFAEDVEERVVAAVRRVLAKAGGK